MVVDNMRLAKRAAWNASRKGGGRHEVADLTQVAAIGLLEAARQWDEDRGIPFEAYGSQMANRRILDYLRHEHLDNGGRGSGKRGLRVAHLVDHEVHVSEYNFAGSLLAIVPVEEYGYQEVEDAHTLDAFDEWLAKRVTPRMLEIYTAWRQGHGERGIQLELANRFNLTEGRISQIISSVMKKAVAFGQLEDEPPATDCDRKCCS